MTIYKHTKKTTIKLIKYFFIPLLIVLGIIFVFALKNFGSFALSFPKITGYGIVEKNYLVIFQNNYELRPSGGFISSYGILNFNNGIPSLKINDIYDDTLNDHKYIQAPSPLDELLNLSEKQTGYKFRDANIYPNFPDTAEELIKMYNLGNSKIKIDGVFAINFSVLEDLFNIFKEIKIGDKILTKDNLFYEIEYEVNNIDKHNLEALANRKSILNALANKLIVKAILSPLSWNKITNKIVENLNNKEIQLYFSDENLQKTTQKNNFTGEFPLAYNDFLAINTANYGSAKTDRYIQKSITYKLKYLKSEKKFKATLSVNISNYGEPNPPFSGTYICYLRSYLPLSANEIESGSDYKTIKSKYFSILGSIMEVPTQKNKTIAYSYYIPEKYLLNNSSEYSLYIPKQSGANNDLYTVIIEMPQDYTIESADFEKKENIAFYQKILEKDLTLKLNFIEDKKSPLIIDQIIPELNVIEIYFNERVNGSTAKEVSNYSVTDLNKNHPERTDTITIARARLLGNKLILDTEGMESQYEEHYQIILKNIKDAYGNSLSKNVEKITAVQRSSM